MNCCPSATNRLLSIVPFASAMMAVLMPLPGQTGETAVTELEPVIVTATRIARPATDVPGAISIIGADELLRRGHSSLLGPLRETPGIQTRSTSANPAQSQIDLRGFGEGAHGRVLVLHDGRRLNSPDMAGIAWLQVPIGQVNRVEILRGSQNVLYGNHALAGVVNIVSSPPSDHPRTDLYAMAGSYGAMAARLSTEGPVGQARFQAGVDAHGTDGYRDNGGFDAWSIHGQLASPPGLAPLSAALRLSFNRLDYDLPGYLSLEEMKNNPRQSNTPGDSSRLDDFSVTADLDTRAGNGMEVALSLAGDLRTMESDMASWASHVDSDISRVSLSPKLSGMNQVMGLEQNWLAGFDTAWDRLEANRFADPGRTAKTVSAQIDRLTAGAYALSDLMLGDKLTLRFGGRLEQARYEADVQSPDAGVLVDDGTTHRASALEAGLRYLASENFRAFARASTLYRYPFVDEQVSYFGYGADGLYDALDPEKGFSLEAGFDGRLNNSLSWEINAYRINMEDEISYNPVTAANENMDRTRRHGIESSLSWKHDSLGSLTLTYDYTRARMNGGEFDGRAVPLVPEQRFGVNCEIGLPAGLSILARLMVVDRQYLGGDYGNLRPTLDGYTTLDLGLRYQSGALPGLEIFAGLDNALDQSYADTGYAGFSQDAYYPAPGRTWKTAAGFSF